MRHRGGEFESEWIGEFKKWETEREKSESQKDRCQVGVSTVDDRDPCRDGICQFPPCSGLVPLFTPHLCKKYFLSWGFRAVLGLYQLWCCLTVSDPDLAGFQSIIKECVSVCSLLLRMSFLWRWLMEKVTSPGGCDDLQQRQGRDQRREMDKPWRWNRLTLWRQRCWLHCNQL